MSAIAIAGRQRRSIPVKCRLRTQQTDYLEHLAIEWGTTLSEALGRLIQRKVDAAAQHHAKPPELARRNFTMTPDHLAYLYAVSGHTGLTRSEVLRRILNEALGRDVTAPKTIAGEFLVFSEG